MTDTEITDLFGKGLFFNLAMAIIKECPDNKLRETALIKLQECFFYHNASKEIFKKESNNDS